MQNIYNEEDIRYFLMNNKNLYLNDLPLDLTSIYNVPVKFYDLERGEEQSYLLNVRNCKFQLLGTEKDHYNIDYTFDWIDYLTQKYPNCTNVMLQDISFEKKCVSDFAKGQIEPLIKRVNIIKSNEQNQLAMLDEIKHKIEKTKCSQIDFESNIL